MTQEKEMEIGTVRIMLRGQPGLSSVIGFPLLLNKTTFCINQDKAVARFRLTSSMPHQSREAGGENSPIQCRADQQMFLSPYINKGISEHDSCQINDLYSTICAFSACLSFVPLTFEIFLVTEGYIQGTS